MATAVVWLKLDVRVATRSDGFMRVSGVYIASSRQSPPDNPDSSWVKLSLEIPDHRLLPHEVNVSASDLAQDVVDLMKDLGDT